MQIASCLDIFLYGRSSAGKNAKTERIALLRYGYGSSSDLAHVVDDHIVFFNNFPSDFFPCKEIPICFTCFAWLSISKPMHNHNKTNSDWLGLIGFPVATSRINTFASI